MVQDAEFAGYVAERLGALPWVIAVALGGSRVTGTQRPDSDWDFSVYYRGRFEPRELRALGWPGEISPIGGWGGGVFNGGAWLRADGRPLDEHYRDLDDVEHHLARARDGKHTQAAHAALAARGEWVTNEKRLTDRAGLRAADRVLAGLTQDPEVLTRAVDAARAFIQDV